MTRLLYFRPSILPLAIAVLGFVLAFNADIVTTAAPLQVCFFHHSKITEIVNIDVTQMAWPIPPVLPATVNSGLVCVQCSPRFILLSSLSSA